jgi:hypothetical protein
MFDNEQRRHQTSAAKPTANSTVVEGSGTIVPDSEKDALNGP